MLMLLLPRLLIVIKWIAFGSSSLLRPGWKSFHCKDWKIDCLSSKRTSWPSGPKWWKNLRLYHQRKQFSRLEIFKKNLKWTKSQSLHCLLTLSISKDLPVPSRTTTQEVADWGIAKCDRDVGVVGDVGIRPGVDLVIKTFYFVCFFRELFTVRLAKPNLTKDWSKWDLLKICPQINS